MKPLVRPKSDLVSQLSLFFLLCTVVPFALLGTLVYRGARTQILHQAEAQLTSVSTLKSEAVHIWLRSNEDLLRGLQQAPLWQDYNDGQAGASEVTAYLERIVRLHPSIVKAFVMDAANGQVLASSDSDEVGTSKSYRTYFQEGRRGLYLQSLYWPPDMKHMAMTISAPVRDKAGQVRQVLAINLNLDDLTHIMTKDTGLGQNIQTYLVNPSHLSLPAVVLQEGFSFHGGIYTYGVDQALAGNTGIGHYTGYGGRPVIGAYRWLPDLQLAFVVEADEGEVLGPLGNFTLLLLLVLGLTLVVANVALYLVTRQIMAPIGELSEVARQVAAGRYDSRVPAPARGGQVSMLVNTFNTMLDDLQDVRLREEQHAQESERTSQQLSALLETSRAISSELDLDKLLQKIMEQAIAMVPGAELGNLLLTEEQEFRLRAVVGFDIDLLEGHGNHIPLIKDWRPELAPLAEVLLQGKVYCLATEAGPNCQLLPDVMRQQLSAIGHPDAQTVLIAPIMVQDQLVGFVNLINCQSPQAFGAEARRMAGLLAAQAATAISNAQLYEQVQREGERFRLLYEASLDVTSSLDLTDVLRSTLHRAFEATGATSGSIFIVDESGHLERHLTPHHDYRKESLAQSLLARIYPDGLAGWVVREKQPVLLHDASHDHRRVPFGDTSLPMPTVRSVLIVPLIHQDRVLGGLSLVDERPGCFRHEHLNLLTGLAAQATTAITHARLFARTQTTRRDWETTFDTIADGIVIADSNDYVVQANHAFARLLNHHPRELVGKRLSSLIFSGDPPENYPTLRTLQTGETSQGELSGGGMRMPGTFFISAYPRRTADGDLVGVVSVWRDVTEERETEARARRLEELNRLIVENAGDLIYAHDLEGNFLFTNPRAQALIGYTTEEATQLNIRDLVAPEHLERELGYMQAPRGTVVPPHEVTLIAKNGDHVSVEVSASPLVEQGWVVGVVGVARDLREIRRLERRLLQAEKLSSLGQLVAGVAHELNNPLTAVIGYTQLLQRTEVDERTKETLQRVNVQAQRAAHIVRNLLTFARQQEPFKESLDMNEVIEETLNLVSYEWRTQNIEIVSHLSPGLPWIVADRQQLQQIFLNLFQNAQQAMSAAHGRGMLAVRTYLVNWHGTRERPAGHYLHVEVQDDGPGMSADTLSHAFDPFFTTKEVGQGTGLGLSICYGIVQEQGGYIWAESELGRGSLFHLAWPVQQPAAHEEPVIAFPAPTHEAPSLSPSSILVVEDEEMLAELVRVTLTENGHQVQVARDGQEALEKLASQEFDLIISDIKMPGMDGQALYHELQRKFPHLTERIIFVTGDTVSQTTAEFLEETGVPVLEKPFRPSELLKVLNQFGK